MFVFVCLFIYSRHRVELAAANSSSEKAPKKMENWGGGGGEYTVLTKTATLKYLNLLFQDQKRIFVV